MFYYYTALLVHTFSYLIWYFISMLETIVMMFSSRDVTGVGYDMCTHVAFHKEL